MGKVSEKEKLINEEYERCVQNVTKKIKKCKQVVELEDEHVPKMKYVDKNIKNYMKEFKKVIREAKHENASTSNALRNYHCALMKCEELSKQLEVDETNQEINNVLNGVVIEINNTCKSVHLTDQVNVNLKV